MADFKIKRIIKNVYKVDYSRCKCEDGDELVITDGVSEFNELFKLYDMENKFIVTPGGYTKGLFFKKVGEVVNSPKYFPEVVKFSLSFFGLKKNSIYKLTVITRDTGDNYIVSRDRKLLVNNSENESLINEDLTGVAFNKEIHAIFKANTNEEVLFFSLGKIVIRDIIIDEVELENGFEEEIDQLPDSEFSLDSYKLVTYSIFNTTLLQENENKKYGMLSVYSGKGLNLYLDTSTNEYILERDNREEILKNSFISSEYVLDINCSKLCAKGKPLFCITTEVSNELSPNTLKAGYLKFIFTDAKGNKISRAELTGKIYILVHKLY